MILKHTMPPRIEGYRNQLIFRDELRRSVLLGAVCRRWRTTTLNTATLWSTINYRSDKGNQYEKLQEEILLRSHHAPLDLHVTYDHPPMSRLVVHTPRIRDLTICCDRMPVLELDVDFPQLENLTLYGLGYLLSRQEDKSVSIFSFAASPMLRKLTLKAFYFFPRIAYGSLTHLALEDMDLPSLGSVLHLISRYAPTLEGLVLRNLSGAVPAHPPAPTEKLPQIHLPRARRLAMGSLKARCDSIQFLKYLIPPASASLHLVGEAATTLPPDLPALAWIGTCTTLAVALLESEVTLVLSGAPDNAAATLSLRWQQDWYNARSAHVPWVRLAAVALHADTLDCSPLLLLDVVREAAPGSVRSLRVALGERMSQRYGREFLAVLLAVIGGSGEKTLGLDELEVWTEDVENHLMRMDLGRQARDVKKVVVHCHTLRDKMWWDQIRRDLPQAEMQLLAMDWKEGQKTVHHPEARLPYTCVNKYGTAAQNSKHPGFPYDRFSLHALVHLRQSRQQLQQTPFSGSGMTVDVTRCCESGNTGYAMTAVNAMMESTDEGGQLRLPPIGWAGCTVYVDRGETRK
ncbi:uncharacterized protein BXZ73DRAFT_78268 [Epithele typhae]|uniref:uncharacterized protein n=1 Tax=Epithele typhae TaxID=378194 RepID=UPI0020084ACE|nr:uncharacterized protein BXZ73DRAFT_78268 [Epithele typhae]KAH9928442.1 hypothetical protein BXZ73DRAFT_78268 [Epithele typhae]